MPNIRCIFICIITILIPVITEAQFPEISGVWITSNGERMIIDYPADLSYCSLVNKQSLSRSLYLVGTGDTLRFQERFEKNGNPVVRNYDFVFASRTDATMNLRPVSSPARQHFQNQSVLKFKKQENWADKTVTFEKLIVHISAAWFDPEMDFQIDSSKRFYFAYEGNISSPSDWKKAQFEGILSDRLYKEFVDLFKRSNPRHVQFLNSNIKDVETYRLIAYFNGKRRVLTSDNPPGISLHVLGFLRDLYKNTKITPTTQRRVLE